MPQSTLDYLNVYGEFIPAGQQLASPPLGEEVVISGISGHFPESVGVYELRDNLRNLGDLVTKENSRRKPGTCSTRYRLGKIPYPEKFDASFFEVDANTAYLADPVTRMQLERTFEAIVDAGVHPHSLKGKSIGVITTGIISESEDNLYKNDDAGKAVLYCNRSLQAAVIAHWLGVNGPVYLVDTACSSSMYALDAAYQFIRNGKCDAAIVSGANLCLRDSYTDQFFNLGLLSPDGRCKSFDDEANGYVRSEAVCTVFLQKAKDARRVYCKLMHVQTNCDGYKQEGMTHPSGHMQELLLSRFYSECGVDPLSVNYFEAHGTGTKVGDREELRAIDNVFSSKRSYESPLLIGSVKSNLGHVEPLAALASIAKVIIGFESGTMPANFNFNKPRAGGIGFQEGRLKVLAQPTPFPGGPVPINSFGVGGTNAHCLLVPNPKKKIHNGVPKDGLPRLVVVSGRTPEAVQTIIKFVQSMQDVDTEYTSLLNEVYTKRISGHIYRGYSVVPAVSGFYENTVKLCPREKKCTIKLLLAMGESKWNPAHIFSLTKFSIFSTKMYECSQALKYEGVDLLRAAISTDGEASGLKNSVTTSVQIGLISVLRAVGVKITEISGYGPARNYAEGKYNLEEAVRVAYRMDLEARKDSGISNMLSVNEEKQGYSTSATSSTSEHVIIAKTVAETVSQLKEDIVLEISPIRKLSHSINVFNNCNALLNLLGRLYTYGIDLYLTDLYEQIEYPVSCGTPMISPFIKWDHSEDWLVNTGNTHKTGGVFDFIVDINMAQTKNKFYYRHVIEGRNLFPASGYFMTAIEAFCLHNSIDMAATTIVCKNVEFKRATYVPKDGYLRFRVTVGRGTHTFDIMESGSITVTGQFEIRHAAMLSDGLEPPTAADPLLMNDADIYKELRLRGYEHSGLFRTLKSLDISGSVGSISWKGNYTAYMENMLQVVIFQRNTRNLYIPVRLNRIVIDFRKHREELSKCDTDKVLPVYCWKGLNIVRSGGIEIEGMTTSNISRRPPTVGAVVESYSFVPYRGKTSLSFEELLRVSVHVALENNPRVRNVKSVEILLDNQSQYLSREVAHILADQPIIQGSLTVLNDAPSSEVLPGIQFVNRSITNESDCLLILGIDVLSRTDPKFLRKVQTALSDNGYIICKESPKSDLLHLEESMTLVMDCTNSDGSDRIVVLKKKQKVPQEVKFINVSQHDYNWLPELKSCMGKRLYEVVVIAQGNNSSGILGLTNCLRLEPGGTHVRCLFIKDPKAPAFHPNHKLYQDQLALNLAVNVYESGAWGSYRHLRLKPLQAVRTQHAYNSVTVTGDLTSFAWQQGCINTSRNYNQEVFVYTYYSALNFRHIMRATGKLSADADVPSRHTQECTEGSEFSGRLKCGRRVMGLADGGCLASVATARKALTWEVPDGWSLAEAATVPCAYWTVIHAFYSSGGSPKGQSILIHAGSGGVGQATINYCLFHGCNVFTTVGTREKKDSLLKLFPQVPQCHIGSSRDTSFEQMIMDQTQGRGVDIVLNSLTGDKLLASIRCLAKGGRFLEVGKLDLVNDRQLSMEFLSRDASFHSVLFDRIIDGPDGYITRISDKFMESIKDGAIKPLTRTVFNVDEVEKAYRFLASGKHTGKVLLEIRPEESQKILRPASLEIEARSRIFCNPEYTYIIIGGLGGFGLELANWLVQRRARKIVLTSRRGVSDGYQKARIKTWERYGVKVFVSTDDITSIEGCCRFLEEANKNGPVGGIFNLAVDLHDATLENQTIETFELSARPKSVATSLLDKFSQKLCPHLHLFVVFSSVTCGRGNAGQTNYGWCNSVMERICETRHSKGLPAVAIQWGAIGDVGVLAKMQRDEDKEIVIGGTLPQKIASCLSLLDTLLLQRNPVVSSMVLAEKCVSLSHGAGVLDSIAKVLGIKNVKTVNHGATLTELGMDSMMAVEIKHIIKSSYEVLLKREEVRNLTLNSIKALSKKSSDRKISIK